MKRARGTSDNGGKEFLFSSQKKSSNKCIDKSNQLAGEVTPARFPGDKLGALVRCVNAGIQLNCVPVLISTNPSYGSLKAVAPSSHLRNGSACPGQHPQSRRDRSPRRSL
jgi:hypothetical protein